MVDNFAVRRVHSYVEHCLSPEVNGHCDDVSNEPDCAHPGYADQQSEDCVF
jgi:hypothetical protein